MHNVLFFLLLALALAAALPAFLVLIQVTAGLTARIPQRPRPVGRQPRLVVVIPAHDEAKSITTTVQRLHLAITADAVTARVLVIADNCSDDTAALARAAGAQVSERHDALRRGKGYALAFAVDSLVQEDWDALVVIDADAWPQPGFLAALSAEFAAGTDAIQGIYSVVDGSDPRMAMSRLALAMINCARPIGRWRLGGSSHIYGNGFALSRRCLAQVPFAPSSALAEDLEHGLALMHAGFRIIPLPHARIDALPPPDTAAVTSQRTRWEAGRLHALLRWTPRLLGTCRWVCWEAVIDLLVPPLAMLVLMQGIVAIAALIAGHSAAMFITFAGLLMLSIALVLGVRVARLPWSRLCVLRHVPMFLLWKLGVYLSSRFWMQKTWVRTARRSAPLLIAVLLILGCLKTRPPDETPLLPPVVRLPITPPNPGEPTVFPRSCRERFARIQPGDVLHLRIDADPRYREGIERTVDPLGRIILPVTGPLPAEGLLPEVLTAKADAALRQWMKTPRCEIEMLRPAERQALVLGAVARQGPVPLRPDDTLLGVISRAGGLVRDIRSKFNDRVILPREARIIRDRTSVALIDLENLLRDGSPASDLAIAPGDLVQIPDPSLRTVVVLGEVVKPGPVTLEDGMDLVQVIAAAGGLTENAAAGGVRLLRGWWRAGGAELHDFDLAGLMQGKSIIIPPALQDRDLVVVPRGSLAQFGYFMRQISPGIVTFTTVNALSSP